MKYCYWIVCPFFLFQNQFISAQTSSQKDEYIFIMGNVINRLYENYDSLIYAYQDYQEYAYIDSTKEILSVIQIHALTKQAGMGIFAQ